MLKTQIQVGVEYAVTQGDHARESDQAGSSNLVKGTVLRYVEKQDRVRAHWLVQLADVPTWGGPIQARQSRCIVAPWADHAPALEENAKARAKARDAEADYAKRIAAAKISISSMLQGNDVLLLTLDYFLTRPYHSTVNVNAIQLEALMRAAADNSFHAGIER